MIIYCEIRCYKMFLDNKQLIKNYLDIKDKSLGHSDIILFLKYLLNVTLLCPPISLLQRELNLNLFFSSTSEGKL